MNKFIGVWGDKFSQDGLNIKVEKKDGKTFWISCQDTEDYLKLQELYKIQLKTELEIKYFKVELL